MDWDTFEVLYRQYYRKLFLYAYSLTHVKEEAEDLTENTFVKALTTFPGGNIQAWMYMVLRNEFLDLKKRQRREVYSADQDMEQLAVEDDVMQTFLENEQRRWLYAQIYGLPEHEREVMLLTVQTDYDDREIGNILGISPGYVRVLRHRGKQRILKKCEEDER